MAKRKDDVSFGFTTKKPEKKPAADAPAESTDAAADPFASTSDTPSDPFASTPDATSSDTPAADPFATSTDAAADPFATTEPTPDPFAATTDTAAADPFASTAAPAADATVAESPADAPVDTETPADEPHDEAASKSPSVREHKQFRIVILADFSGRTNRGVLSTSDEIAARKAVTIDADTFDRVMAKMNPQIQLPVSDTAVVALAFKGLEDFRPDSLLQRIEAFQGLLQLRADLKDAKKFKETAAKVRKLTGVVKKKPAKVAAKGAAGAAADHEAGESDFERLLNQTVAPKGAAEVDTQAFIANLVAGYSVPDADPEQGKLTQLLEDALSAGLRAVLRHPAFQGVEGAWRGVELLTSRLNTDEDLKICLFDISKEELYADLINAPTIQKSGMYQVLVEQTRSAGVAPFSLVIGDYEFDQTPQNVALLAKVASLAHEAGIPFVGGGGAKIAGFPSFYKFPDSGKWQPPADGALWEKIRGHKLAAHVGLAAPRFLARLPYGPKTDAIDAYPFNEMPDSPVMEGYLWVNGAFAVALAMGQGFLDNGWGFEPVLDVTDLPCHMAMVDGDKEMTPCAQGWLSDRVGAILHQQGLIPLLSVRNAASVKIAGIHSIAKGGKALAASWASA